MIKNTKNPLLLKDQQGRVKEPTYDLPAENHTYGKKIIDDPEPIKYVVNGWTNASSSQAPLPKVKNFKEMNKLSLKQGAITAKGQQDFRKTTNIMVQNKKGQRVMPIMLPEQQFTYGVSNRPSTPVKLVIGNCYGLQKEQQNNQKYMRETMMKEQQKNKKLQAAKTKSQKLRQEKAKQQKNFRQKSNVDTQFKLRKYTSINTTKVHTRLGGFKANESQTK